MSYALRNFSYCLRLYLQKRSSGYEFVNDIGTCIFYNNNTLAVTCFVNNIPQASRTRRFLGSWCLPPENTAERHSSRFKPVGIVVKLNTFWASLIPWGHDINKRCARDSIALRQQPWRREGGTREWGVQGHVVVRVVKRSVRVWHCLCQRVSPPAQITGSVSATYTWIWKNDGGASRVTGGLTTVFRVRAQATKVNITPVITVP